MVRENSLRSLGRATIGIDKPTQARLKRLAGDTPLCLKVRELIADAERRELPGGGGGEVPLPGQELLTSQNTIAALSSEVRSLSVLVSALLDSVRQDGISFENRVEPLRAWAAGSKVELAEDKKQRQGVLRLEAL